MRGDSVFVDTNVLVYLFDGGAKEKQRAARARLASEVGDREFFVSTQVLQELYAALTRGKSPIATHEIAESAVRYATSFSVVQVDVPLVLSAISRRNDLQLSFWDSLIVVAAQEAGCSTLLTEDLNHGQSFDGVSVENPFRS